MRICSAITALTIWTLMTFTTSAAHAAPMVYDVSSTGQVNCSGSPHGFWTNGLRHGGGSCSQYYDYQSDATLSVDTTGGEAVLSATAINPQGIKAVINFTWQDLVPAALWTGMVKNGGGGNPADWLYFTSGSGNAKFYDGATLLGSVDLALIPNTALQVGYGANDKTPAFGASSWLVPLVAHGGYGKNWDFNMDLVASVPAGGAVIPMLLALLGLGMRRQVKSPA